LPDWTIICDIQILDISGGFTIKTFANRISEYDFSCS
jgi:hypothetical protein